MSKAHDKEPIHLFAHFMRPLLELQNGLHTLSAKLVAVDAQSHEHRNVMARLFFVYSYANCGWKYIDLSSYYLVGT